MSITTDLQDVVQRWDSMKSSWSWFSDGLDEMDRVLQTHRSLNLSKQETWNSLVSLTRIEAAVIKGLFTKEITVSDDSLENSS